MKTHKIKFYEIKKDFQVSIVADKSTKYITLEEGVQIASIDGKLKYGSDENFVISNLTEKFITEEEYFIFIPIEEGKTGLDTLVERIRQSPVLFLGYSEHKVAAAMTCFSSGSDISKIYTESKKELGDRAVNVFTKILTREIFDSKRFGPVRESWYRLYPELKV